MKLKFEGIWTPIPTPLTKHGKVDTDATRRLVDFHIAAGIDGLLPLGTSGEFALLSREERGIMVKTVADQADSRVPVVAGGSGSGSACGPQLSRDRQKGRGEDRRAPPPTPITTTAGGEH